MRTRKKKTSRGTKLQRSWLLNLSRNCLLRGRTHNLPVQAQDLNLYPGGLELNRVDPSYESSRYTNHLPRALSPRERVDFL